MHFEIGRQRQREVTANSCKIFDWKKGDKMKRNSPVFGLFAIVVFLLWPLGKLSITGNAHAQESTRPVLPTPEMHRLAEFYVGTWDYTESYPKSASNSEGEKNTGVYTSELGPGGNSLVNRFHSRGPAGDFEGMLVMTWDPNEKAYKEYVFGNEFTGAIIETGQWEGDMLVYRGELSARRMKLALRNATKLTAPGKIVSEQFSGANGSPEALLVRVEAIKRP